MRGTPNLMEPSPKRHSATRDAHWLKLKTRQVPSVLCSLLGQVLVKQSVNFCQCNFAVFLLKIFWPVNIHTGNNYSPSTPTEAVMTIDHKRHAVICKIIWQPGATLWQLRYTLIYHPAMDPCNEKQAKVGSRWLVNYCSSGINKSKRLFLVPFRSRCGWQNLKHSK